MTPWAWRFCLVIESATSASHGDGDVGSTRIMPIATEAWDRIVVADTEMPWADSSFLTRQSPGWYQESSAVCEGACSGQGVNRGFMRRNGLHKAVLLHNMLIINSFRLTSPKLSGLMSAHFTVRPLRGGVLSKIYNAPTYCYTMYCIT